MPYRLSTVLALFALLGGAVLTAAQEATPSPAVTCEADFRVVEHDLLDEPICVPDAPERVIALDVTAFELMLMLEMEPVARMGEGSLQALYGSAPAVYERVSAMLEGLPVHGEYYELNVEVGLELEPDLVISWPGNPTNEQLAGFTTVVITPVETREVDWAELSSFYAAVLGVTDEYEEAMAAYEERMDVFIENRDPALDGASLVYLQDAGGQNFLGLPGLPLWETISDAGFVPVETLPTTPEDAYDTYGDLIAPFNEEQIELIDADVILLANGNIQQDDFEAANALIESYESDPLWAQLYAVQNGQFYPVSVHWQSNGLISAHATLDDMFVFFTDMDADEIPPNPFVADAE